MCTMSYVPTIVSHRLLKLIQKEGTFGRTVHLIKKTSALKGLRFPNWGVYIMSGDALIFYGQTAIIYHGP